MSSKLTPKEIIISSAVGLAIGLFIANRMDAKLMKSVNRAVDLYHRDYDRPVIGFWVDGEDIILNVIPEIPDEPAQWLVKPSGEVYNTNPLRNSVITRKPMMKYKYAKNA